MSPLSQPCFSNLYNGNIRKDKAYDDNDNDDEGGDNDGNDDGNDDDDNGDNDDLKRRLLGTKSLLQNCNMSVKLFQLFHGCLGGQ